MKNETYPFMGVQVGSCVFAAPGKFNPTVIDGKITTTILQEAEWRSIRGQSNFVYTKEMNQGSFGVSGSHGLSGLSKINWSLSAYLGKAAAESSKSVKVNFEVMACGGVEHVDFANLTPSLLMAGMKRGPQQDLTKALNAYLDLSKFLKDKGKDLFDALTWAAPKDAKSQEYKDHKKFHDLFQAWMTSVSSFKLAYGEGMVVAAAWGGIGIVSVELTHKDRDNNWKYGGEAQFSYANAFHSVSLHALYDGSQSSGGADVKGAVEGFHVGSCVATQTEKWLAAVESSLLKGLDQTDIMAKAQEVKVGAAIKDPPPFVKPQEDKGIADKIKSIDSLDALKAYAKAAAYDEERKKKGNEKLTLEEFLQKAEEPADRRKLDELHNAAVNSDVRAIPPSHPKKRVAAKAAAVKASAATRAKTVKQRAKAASAESSPFSGYVPLGLWISNWDHLFPWLATGWLNSIMDTQTASTVVRYRAMMQDFLALSRLYYIADNCHFELDVLRVEFRQIAESFGNACNVLQEATTEDEYEVKMQEAYHGYLSPNARAIYDVWDANSFLRGSELGLGIVDRDSHSPHVNENAKSIYSHAEISMGQLPNGFPGAIIKMPMETLGWFSAERRKIDFNPDLNSKGHSVFAGFYKVLPLIHPGTKKIYAFGPGNGVLASWSTVQNWQMAHLGFLFANKNVANKNNMNIFGLNLGVGAFTATPFEFTPNRANRVLENSATGIKLYPIPFRAAGATGWRGPSFSANVASMSDLGSQLEALQKELKQSNAWGFSSDGWIPNWKCSDYYRFNQVKKQYIGLMDSDKFTGMGK